MASRSHLTLLLLLRSVYLAMASSGSRDCASLAHHFPGKVYLPATPEYAAGKTSYWAAFENEVSPSCFVQPSNAHDLASIVQFVRSSHVTGHTPVAIRSGGHTAWAGSANVQEGITIDLSKLDHFAVDTHACTASIGVGLSWGDVYRRLEKQGLAIVGGRVAKVGVGGLTLGGNPTAVL